MEEQNGRYGKGSFGLCQSAPTEDVGHHLPTLIWLLSKNHEDGFWQTD